MIGNKKAIQFTTNDTSIRRKQNQSQKCRKCMPTILTYILSVTPSKFHRRKENKMLGKLAENNVFLGVFRKNKGF